MDADDHAKTRGLLSKLITPKRLSENEEFMWRNFTISEKHHGAPENRVYEYDPTFIMRGLSGLHIAFEPV